MYIENQSYENMSLIKVGLPFLNSMKKNRKDLADFWHEKWHWKSELHSVWP